MLPSCARSRNCRSSGGGACDSRQPIAGTAPCKSTPSRRKDMNDRKLVALLLTALMPLAAFAWSEPQSQPPKVQIPQPGVAQIMTIEGEFVRVAYNNEGYISL